MEYETELSIREVKKVASDRCTINDVKFYLRQIKAQMNKEI